MCENKRPIIGVTPQFDIENNRTWIYDHYLDCIREYGAVTIILPYISDKNEIKEIVSRVDGVMFTGGQDIEPAIYGAQKSGLCGAVSERRDEAEMLIMQEAFRQGKPIFGICRGVQLINAAFGGTLYQDIGDEYGEHVEHSVVNVYGNKVHSVNIEENTVLYKLLGGKRFDVNSHHHQAVKDVAPGFEVMARSDDGIIEAIRYCGDKFVWGVQWHPEFDYKIEINGRILKNFVDAAEK